MATRKGKTTQEQCAFYILLQKRKHNKLNYHSPSIVDVGDVMITELNEWVWTTWKTPTRLTDIFQNNPTLLERISCKAKAGNNYYKYRIAETAGRKDIIDPRLLAFWDKISKKNKE